MRSVTIKDKQGLLLLSIKDKNGKYDMNRLDALKDLDIIVIDDDGVRVMFI